MPVQPEDLPDGTTDLYWNPPNDCDLEDYVNIRVRCDARPDGTGLDAGVEDALILNPWDNTHLMQDLFYVSMRMLPHADRLEFQKWSPDLFSESTRFGAHHWEMWMKQVYPRTRAKPSENTWCTHALVGMIESYMPHFQWKHSCLLRVFQPHDNRLTEATELCSSTRKLKPRPVGLKKNSSKLLLDRFVCVLNLDEGEVPIWEEDPAHFDQNWAIERNDSIVLIAQPMV